MSKKDQFFVPENKITEKTEYSPSGKYKLVISLYKTKPGCWAFSRGEVYRCSDNSLIADVKRNYDIFHHLWLEQLTDGHDYLLCGEDYQGQTFVQLDTNTIKHYLPEKAKEGFGFCWVSYSLLPDKITLQVDGCYWGCPYMTIFVDVSDTMNGWPTLCVDFDIALFTSTGTIKYLDTPVSAFFDSIKDMTVIRVDGDQIIFEEGRSRLIKEIETLDNLMDDNPDLWVFEPYLRLTMTRAGNKLVLIEHWFNKSQKKRTTEKGEPQE